MNSKACLILSLFIVVLSTGCSQVMEVSKTFWGSSTRALENARSDGVSKAFACNFDQCFDFVVDLTVDDETQIPIKEKEFGLFLKNRQKKHLVLIKVPGSVNTTEVGVFFTPLTDTSVKVDISSLSSYAKATVSKIIFEKLGQKYQVVE